MASIFVNGVKLEAEEGASLLQTATEAGIEIPHYCYHPGLQIAGSCRMCQVEIQGIPKLQVACNTRIKDGMAIATDTEKVRKARSSVLEFLLLNHPLDCPVCDQAGECNLQGYYMRFGGNGSRLADDKLKRQKAKPIGPHVILDQDRCILCTRCIRFCQQVPQTSELGIFNRGDHSIVDIYPGRELDNKYSGNVVDICPVGALTDRDFRFQVRVWYLRQGDSLCTGCSRGCNIRAYYNPTRSHHANGRRIVRLKPRFNERVNKWWMCDDGRYHYRFLDDNRLVQPQHRRNGEVEQLDWKEIIPELATRLQAILDEFGPEAVAVLGSAELPNEDLYLARTFFKEGLGINHCAFGSPADQPGDGDAFLITPDKKPNRRGAQALAWPDRFEGRRDIKALMSGGSVRALIVFRHDLGSIYSEHELSKLVEGLDVLVYLGTNVCSSSQVAHYVLPAAVHVERDGTFTNVDGWVQRFFRVVNPLGEALPDWRIMQMWAAAMGLDYDFRRCENLFVQLSTLEHSFAGLTYAAMAKQGQRLNTEKLPMGSRQNNLP